MEASPRVRVRSIFGHSRGLHFRAPSFVYTPLPADNNCPIPAEAVKVDDDGDDDGTVPIIRHFAECSDKTPKKFAALSSASRRQFGCCRVSRESWCRARLRLLNETLIWLKETDLRGRDSTWPCLF